MVLKEEGTKQVLALIKAVEENVPTNLSQLKDDSENRTVSDSQIEAWDNKVGGVSVLPKLTSGTEIATIFVDQFATKLYAPTGGGEGESGLDLLWENPTPEENFAAQTLSLNLDNYKGIFVIYKSNKTGTAYFSSFVEKRNTTVLFAFTGANSSSAYMWSRNITITADRGSDNSLVTFENGYRKTLGSTAAGTANAQYLIPTAIYGVK